MSELDAVRDLALCYLWTRQQLTESQAKQYRAWLNRTYKQTGTGTVGLDSTLIEAAERIAQMSNLE
jgi:hypothetical protein